MEAAPPPLGTRYAPAEYLALPPALAQAALQASFFCPCEAGTRSILDAEQTQRPCLLHRERQDGVDKAIDQQQACTTAYLTVIPSRFNFLPPASYYAPAGAGRDGRRAGGQIGRAHV